MNRIHQWCNQNEIKQNSSHLVEDWLLCLPLFRLTVQLTIEDSSEVLVVVDVEIVVDCFISSVLISHDDAETNFFSNFFEKELEVEEPRFME